MKVKLIPIGNSKGVRIPRSVIEQCRFGDEVEMNVANGVVELAPVRSVRQGWDDAFARMATAGDDALLLPDDLEHGRDAEEWEW